MAVRFKGATLLPVLEEALNYDVNVAFIKDHGVCFISEVGDLGPDMKPKHIAYAIGCDPGVDDFDTWWHRSNHEFGGDELVLVIPSRNPSFALVATGLFDIDVFISDTHLHLRPVRIEPDCLH